MKYVGYLAAVIAIAVVVRWWFISTFMSREKRRLARESAAAPRSASARLMAKAAWPVFFVLVAIVCALGMLTAILVGPH
jgi:hypothetical protein